MRKIARRCFKPPRWAFICAPAEAETAAESGGVWRFVARARSIALQARFRKFFAAGFFAACHRPAAHPP